MIVISEEGLLFRFRKSISNFVEKSLENENDWSIRLFISINKFISIIIILIYVVATSIRENNARAIILSLLSVNRIIFGIVLSLDYYSGIILTLLSSIVIAIDSLILILWAIDVFAYYIHDENA